MPRFPNGVHTGVFDLDTVQDLALKARIRLQDPHLLVVCCTRNGAELWLLTETLGSRGPAPAYRIPVQVLSLIEWYEEPRGQNRDGGLADNCVFLPWRPSRGVSGVGSVKVHARRKDQP